MPVQIVPQIARARNGLGAFILPVSHRCKRAVLQSPNTSSVSKLSLVIAIGQGPLAG